MLLSNNNINTETIDVSIYFIILVSLHFDRTKQ